MADVKFRPVATPVDTVAANTRLIEGVRPVAPVRPLAPVADAYPQAPQRTDVNQLINALAGFSSGVQRLSQQYTDQARQQDGLDAEMRAMRDNVTSWSAAVAKDPSLADKSPYYRSIYESRSARNAVQQRAGQLLTEYYSSGLMSSDDPNAVKQWFNDKTKDLLDQATTPGGREATIEELQRVQQQFAQAHSQNAVKNLVQKNENGVSSNVQGLFDNYQARGPATPYKTDDPVAPNLQPYEKAFLNGLAAGESGGKYNIRYTPKGGALFDMNGQHPNVREPTADGRTSDAAGRYQFLSSTWKDIMGNAPFTPENQDIAALKLARRDFKTRTGEDLDEVLKKEGFSNRVQSALAPTWQALTGNRNRHSATYNASLAAAGGKAGDAITQNSNLPELMGDLERTRKEGMAQGLAPEKVDELVVQATANAMVTHQDETLMNALMLPRADGTPGAGMTVKGRDVLEDAKKRVFALRTQAESHAYTMQQHERQEKERAWNSDVYQTLFAQMERGEAPNIPLDVLRKASEVDPAFADKAISIQKTLQDVNKAEDTGRVAQFSARIYGGQGTPDDVLDAIGRGDIKDPSTIRDLLKEARRNIDQSAISHPIAKQAIDDIKQLVGEPFESGVLANPERGSQAMMAMRRSIIGFKEANPKATEGEMAEYMQKEVVRIAKVYKPGSQLDEYEIGNVARKAPGIVTTPDAAPAPNQPKGQKASADPAPRSNVEWKSVRLYGDANNLDDQYRRFKAKDFSNNPFAEWVANLNLMKPEDALRFYNAQKGFASQGGGQSR